MQAKVSGRLRRRLLSASEELHKQDAPYKRASNIDFILWLAIFVTLAFAIRMFVFEPVLVDGDSMYPSLLHGERMFVEKVSYLFEAPQRGDVVIVRYPYYNENCVKRVIGRPGDEVAVSEGVVYLNGRELNESQYWEGIIWEDMDPVVVPHKSIFVMGDNRNYSTDSRDATVGPIPYAQVVGKVHSVIWPFSAMRNVYTGMSPMVGMPYEGPGLLSNWAP